MCRNSLKLFSCIALTITLLFSGACTLGQPAVSNPSDKPDPEEIALDPGIERDAQMIIDTFGLSEKEKKDVIAGVKYLRNKEIGTFASIEIISKELIPQYEKPAFDYIIYFAEIVDDRGEHIRVGFNERGLVNYIIRPSEDSGMWVVFENPVF